MTWPPGSLHGCFTCWTFPLCEDNTGSSMKFYSQQFTRGSTHDQTFNISSLWGQYSVGIKLCLFKVHQGCMLDSWFLLLHVNTIVHVHISSQLGMFSSCWMLHVADPMLFPGPSLSSFWLWEVSNMEVSKSWVWGPRNEEISLIHLSEFLFVFAWLGGEIWQQLAGCKYTWWDEAASWM